METTQGYNLYSAAYLIAVLVHPLHYYAYVIKPEQNCLEISDGASAVIATVLIFNIYVLLTFIIKLRKTGRRGMKYVFFTQIPVWFMTLMLIPDFTSGYEDRILPITVDVLLYVHILLLLGLRQTITIAIEKKSACNFPIVWGKAALNFSLYILGGQIYGALWYSFAIDRVLECWREDYFSRNHFDPHSFLCRRKHKNLGELNCPKLKNIGTENNDFGIFSLALQSRIVYLYSTRDFIKKFVYCFRWGLQALSCFGQNLFPNTFILENIFVILITITSTLLFVSFIGSVETYLQPKSEESNSKEPNHSDSGSPSIIQIENA